MEESAKILIEEISSLKTVKSKQLLKLIPQLNISTETGTVSIGFKVGAGRLYIVKDVAYFLDIVSSRGILPFGKNFIYDGNKYEFDETADMLLSLLNASFGKGFRQTSGEKSIQIKTNIVLPVFKLLSNLKPDIYINEKHYPGMNICNGDIPVVSELSEKRGILKIIFEDFLNISPIMPDYSVCRYFNELFIVSQNQAKLIASFLKAYKTDGKVYVNINPKLKQRVLTKVMPKLKVASNLIIDEAVKRDVIVGELITKVYLDKTEDGDIKATAYFCYGDAEFNHFAGEKPSIASKVLLRDFNKENEFIITAAKMGFVPKDGNLYIYNDSDIYDFVTGNVNQLKSFGEVYYSKTFDMPILSPTRGDVGISLAPGNVLNFTINYDGIDVSELESVFNSIQEKKTYHRLKSGTFVNLEADALVSGSKLIENLDIKKDGLNNASADIPLSKAFYLSGISSDNLSVKKDTYFTDFVSRFENASFEDYELPEGMEDILRPYQKIGFKWLKLLASFGLGGILADEMGLGKTLQAIAFVKSEYEKTKKPSLIVAPTSLLYNWYNEIKKFSPDSSVCIISGDPAERKALVSEIDKYCFVITSYGILRRDAHLYANTSLAYCIIDEAQQIKNPNTINAKSVKSLKAQGFFALTGTPLENNLTELWSIFDFVMPGYLFSRHKFRTMYEIPIVKEESKDSLNELLKHTKPFILRRLKSQVMSELPQKIESKIVCEPTQKQKLLYTAYASAAKKEINALIDNGSITRNHIKILSMITRLRQLCCHPSLFVENYNGGSGKLDVLIDLLESSIDSGHRVLIFSQFTSMLSIIAATLNEIGISFFYLDGHTPSKSRVEMADKFNNGEKSVFLISLKAGGTGLNLTGADMVIHFDPWWNPAVENQATDRVHRIGQTKSVQVIKFVAKDTIEEKIHEIQQIKQNMIDNVLETGETLLSSMTIEEIKSLFE